MGENGKRLIDKIIALAPTERRKLYVPEWDVTLYFPALTKAQLEEAVPKDDVPRSALLEGLYLLVHTAQDEQGNRVFAQKDIDGLREKADLSTVTRVEAFMWGTIVPPLKEAEKEIQADPPSASV